MRVEPYGVGSIVHVIKRGARGTLLVRDERDKAQFAESLFHFNDSHIDPNRIEALKACVPLERPGHWPDRDPLVLIHAWALVSNHFHLLLEEIREGGIAKFMQRLCGSMSVAFNAKYAETGSLFQSSYKSRTVDGDAYLRYLAFYIQVKNVLELYPGGLKMAVKNFDDAWEWALAYPFSSLPAYAANKQSPIADMKLFSEMFPDKKAFKEEAREMILLNMHQHEEYADLILEPW